MRKGLIIPLAILLMVGAATAGTIIYYFSITATGNVELSLISADSMTAICEGIYDGDIDAKCTEFSLTNRNNVEFKPVFEVSTSTDSEDVNAVLCRVEGNGDYIPAGETTDFNILCSPQRMYQGTFEVIVSVR